VPGARDTDAARASIRLIIIIIIRDIVTPPRILRHRARVAVAHERGDVRATVARRHLAHAHHRARTRPRAARTAASDDSRDGPRLKLKPHVDASSTHTRRPNPL
jgi:hypothetical protein